MNALARVFERLFGAPPKFPTPDECRQLSESVLRSPDLGVLEESEFQLLFCPDRTQRGCSEYSLIEESIFCNYAYTEECFNYWQQRDGLPIPLMATDQRQWQWVPPSLKIKGEIHAVRSHQFKHLDNYKDNLVSFRRERLTFLVPNRPLFRLPERYNENGIPIPLVPGQYGVGKETVHRVQAWMYIGVHDYWDDLLDGGYNFKPVVHYKDERPWLKEYYSLPREKYF
jgi:hypothetical protein